MVTILYVFMVFSGFKKIDFHLKMRDKILFVHKLYASLLQFIPIKSKIILHFLTLFAPEQRWLVWYILHTCVIYYTQQYLGQV